MIGFYKLVRAGKRGRPIVDLWLGADERPYLEQQVRRHKAPHSLSDRCRIFLRCADGLNTDGRIKKYKCC